MAAVAAAAKEDPFQSQARRQKRSPYLPLSSLIPRLCPTQEAEYERLLCLVREGKSVKSAATCEAEIRGAWPAWPSRRA